MNIYLHCKNKTIKTNQSFAIIHNIHIHLHGTTKHFSSQACTIRAKLNTALKKQRKNLNFQYLQRIEIQNFLIIRVAKQVYDCTKSMFHIGQNNNISKVRRSTHTHLSFLSNRLHNSSTEHLASDTWSLRLYPSTLVRSYLFFETILSPFLHFLHLCVLYYYIYTTFSSHKLFKSKRLCLFKKIHVNKKFQRLKRKLSFFLNSETKRSWRACTGQIPSS